MVDVLFEQAGRADARAPHAGPGLSAGRDHASARSRPSRRSTEQFEVLRTNADMVAERERIAPYLEAEPDKTLAFIAEMDMAAPGGRRPGRLRLPDAPGGGQRGARPLPEVRDEAAGGRGAGDDLHLPDAPRGRQRRAGPLPEVRHEAAAGAARRRGRRRPRARRARAPRAQRAMRTTTRRRRDRVGRRHGRGQPHDDAGQHALEADRPRRPGPRTRRSTGGSASATRSRSGCSTRWPATTRCTTRSTSTAPAAS